VTNVPVTAMPATEVIAKYHDLWKVEKSFRMSKSDLRGRPMFHYTRAAIEAHLTIVFTALAMAHAIQSRTGLSIAKVVKQLRPLRTATININGATPNLPTRNSNHRTRNPRPPRLQTWVLAQMSEVSRPAPGGAPWYAKIRRWSPVVLTSGAAGPLLVFVVVVPVKTLVP
jgi:hypothetical protein